MPGGEQSRNPVNRRPEVVSISLLRCPSMQSHPHPDGCSDLTPLLSEKLALSQVRRLEGAGRARERRAESVAHGLEDVAVVLLDSFPQDLVVAD